MSDDVQLTYRPFQITLLNNTTSQGLYITFLLQMTINEHGIVILFNVKELKDFLRSQCYHVL